MIDNLNDTYAMKKLFLLVIVLFLSFQQVTLAAIGEAANTPDSVFLFSYATSRDDGRSGLRFAWSMDQKHWFAVGQGTGYLRCDYSRWGSDRKSTRLNSSHRSQARMPSSA